MDPKDAPEPEVNAAFEAGDKERVATALSTEDMILAQVLQLREQGTRGVEDAARMLHRNLFGWMCRYFMRHRIPEATAEELTNDVWLKVLTGTFKGEGRPTAWVRSIARNLLIDWIREFRAEKRGSQHEVTLAFDDWLTVLDTTGARRSPEWVRLCLERAAWQMEQDDPARLEVLAMVADGWSNAEIAIYYGADPENVSSKEEGAARDRVYQARKKAKE